MTAPTASIPRRARLSHLLTKPCSSRFASEIYARAQIRGISTSHNRRNVTVNRAAAVEAASENIELGPPAAYLSESSDPWFNLAFEDWLLRNSLRNEPTLFLYRNDPCVVIGRNQNPWQEATPRKLLEWGIPLVRRRSGGGTVFHDRGNTNFSIILPRLLFTRAHGAELVARAVRERLGVGECTVNKRNDVTIHDARLDKDFKVSGSAYKIIQHRAYHHGTMLISSDLSELGRAIKSSSPNIQGKSVPSFRSPVTTLNTYLPPSLPAITHDTFTRAVIDEFAAVYSNAHASAPTLEPKRIREADVREPKVWAGADELKSWEWTYGQTPEFGNEIEGDLSFGEVSASISARHALITSASLHYMPPPTASTSAADRADAAGVQGMLDQLALEMVGRRYETLEELEAAEGSGPGEASVMRERRSEVIAWLRASM